MKGNNGIYEGLSTDTKPTDVPVNTLFHELNTDKFFFWDGENWTENPHGGGAGFEPTDAQLTAMNSGITATDVEQINTNKTNILLSEQMNGAKNMLRFDGLSRTSNNGVSFALNSDFSITATRTEPSSSTALTELTLNGNNVNIDSYCDEHHYLTGCPNGGSFTSYETLARALDTPNYIERDYGDGALLVNRRTTSNITYQIAVRSGFTGSVTFKPMIITKSAYDAGYTDYQPYAMSNVELTAAIQAIQAQLANS